ncbi:hypothetical protein PMIN06_012863 [Paraphaeosphaeria minitans]|uniref:F-box domain-containing protein n=1 Tax=Paraphaeosphaeria minitans TaxID=565426 RepID=A0A9P6GAI6_9PLEO|nr:hypothetical protein PMIN01_10793 [Paraphaeosphaeria minitans]
MKTRNGEPSTRRSTRAAITRGRPTRKEALGLTKPQSQTNPTRKAPTTKKGLSLALALKDYYKQSSTDPNACHSKLLGIPIELFTHITTFLPPEALICLSLSCKLALQYTGAECWRHPEIRKHRYYCRRHLMQCLIRDDPPDLTFCVYCNTLHPPLKPPRTHRVTKLTKTCFSQWAAVEYVPQVRDEEKDCGYSLLHAHIQEVFNKRDADPAAAQLLSGNYATSKNPAFTYDLSSSADWIDRRLVLQHTHVFRAPSRAPLKLAAILALPVRLCAHLSTTTAEAEKGQYVGKTSDGKNTPFLTHAIASAFPAQQCSSAPKPATFRNATPLEQKQMDAAEAGEEVVWKCRGCVTKFKVGMENDGALRIVSWHCFGADLLHANKYWEWLVRREVANLGAAKRNSEYWFPAGRSVPDFKIVEG